MSSAGLSAAQEPERQFPWLPPSIAWRDDSHIDFRVKLHSDYRTFRPGLRQLDSFDFRRARVGIDGDIRNVDFEVEYDFREIDYPLRDAFVDASDHRAASAAAANSNSFSRDG